MSRRSARHGNGRRGSRRRLALLLALGLFPIDTAMTAASPIEAGASPTASIAPPGEIHLLQRSTENTTPPNAGGVDRVAT